MVLSLMRKLSIPMENCGILNVLSAHNASGLSLMGSSMNLKDVNIVSMTSKCSLLPAVESAVSRRSY